MGAYSLASARAALGVPFHRPHNFRAPLIRSSCSFLRLIVYFPQQTGGRGWGALNSGCGNDGWESQVPTEDLGTSFGVVYYPSGANGAPYGSAIVIAEFDSTQVWVDVSPSKDRMKMQCWKELVRKLLFRFLSHSL
jgi:hypothetical protein